jgi:rifampicin phosphotransferase
VKSAVRAMERVDRAEPGVVRLDDPRARDPELVGAKAAALATAKLAGLPVLPGVVLTTAFQRGTSEHRAQLQEAWSDISHAGEVSLVVRSSSTIEDTGASSMAGMFTSVLGVSGWEEFEAAIDTVLASSNVVPLGSGGDRRADGRPAGAPAPMAVLVQPYLVSTSGGVLFGLDPVTGREDRIVVSATDQGPNALVSGEVDGIRYILSRRGRTVEGPPAGSGLLRRRQLHTMARVAAHAARVFGGPQDIEWAFDTGGHFRLLQSRPVTARGEAGAAEGPVLGPGPVAETFPDALLPLEEDLWAAPLGEALRHALTLGSTAPRHRLATSPVLRSVGGRLAVDLDLMPDATPSGSLLSKLDPRPPMRRLIAAWRVGRLRAALPVLAGDLLARADDDLLSVDAVEALSDDELLGILFNSRQGLVALHGHEVLMGWLIDAPTATTVTAASVALRFLVDARSAGMADEEVVARHPGVLALVAPRITAKVELPPTPDALPPAPSTPTDISDPGLLREALRLRARWLQELTARAAWELGRRLTDRGAVEHPHDVALLRLDELETAVRTGAAPADLPGRTTPISPPLPARFRLTPGGGVVAIAPARRGRRGRGGLGGAQGAGGGRGVGHVHDGSDTPAEGAVLVVRTLDPGLAPVLPRLGGLIAETGSPLSHLAILAREVGVPTVVGVEGATTRFPPGSRVMVDGTSGEVELLEAGLPVADGAQPVEQKHGGAA